MNAQKIADKLVEKGIGYADHIAGISEYDIDCKDDTPMTADEFITDWRVAGKVLESMTYSAISTLFKEIADHNGLLIPVTPRAICERWFAAQENEGE